MSGVSSRPLKVILPDSELPRHWYNALADLPSPLEPVLSPATLQPVTAEELGRIFPPALLEQEMSTERFIPIPDPVREAYLAFRPTPLYRARRLEESLGTPARIYYKYEGVSPSGSHKTNTALPQAYYNREAGIRRLATETGAGQWGSALSMACRQFGLGCTVYMVRVSYEQKPYRRILMHAYGAEVLASPSERTLAGRQTLARNPDSPGSLGIAISEAVEDAASHDDTNYALGSVLNHVLLHQTVIGQEARAQLSLVGEYPDVVIGCFGGGSNFAGLALPFLADKAAGKEVRLVAVEPSACPSLTRGAYAYDYGDTAGLTPIMRMYTLGHGFVPPGIHAGGLRYHGASPLVSRLRHDGLVEAVAHHQSEVFTSAIAFTRAEGILPAPESAHAIHQAVVEARQAAEEGRERVILFNLSGHGHFDLAAYEAYLGGKLQDYVQSDEELAQGLAALPQVAAG
ncbi:MAG: TrpB-like pyridoxal phosphate-dependent enzyme [Bacillota bacterium]|nr:TrpB-like pyridoxal phosphate-dependent enzyme [Bacillota bacterium]